MGLFRSECRLLLVLTLGGEWLLFLKIARLHLTLVIIEVNLEVQIFLVTLTVRVVLVRDVRFRHWLWL